MYRGKVIPLHNDLNAMIAAEHQYTQALEEARLQLQSLDKKMVENLSLASVVQDLPLKISHSVMVPFGKAAFIPGRLIHTNEFLVHLGEGVFATRSAAQTVDLLTRRTTWLEEAMHSVKSKIATLEMETLQVGTARREALGLGVGGESQANGMVEIREEYEGVWDSRAASPHPSAETAEESHETMREDASPPLDDAALMRRMEELERAEEKEEEEVHIRAAQSGAKSAPAEPRLPQRKPSESQLRAFTGSVGETNSSLIAERERLRKEVPPPQSQPTSRPISKFKSLQTGVNRQCTSIRDLQDEPTIEPTNCKDLLRH